MNKGNTASSPPDGFARNLPKNLTTHLTHKLYSVFPDKHDAKTISLFSLHTNERQPEILQLESQAVCYPLKTPFTSDVV